MPRLADDLNIYILHLFLRESRESINLQAILSEGIISASEIYLTETRHGFILMANKIGLVTVMLVITSCTRF